MVKRDNKAAGSEILSKDGCIFKRGGKCITHGCMEVMYRSTESKWDVKKDGTYGGKYLKKTRYKCQFERVPASNRSNSELGSEERTKSSQRAGNSDNSDNKLRLELCQAQVKLS